MHWEVEMFGGLRVSRGGVEIGGFQTRKTAALFAYLAYYSQKRHLREELADLLWPDAELESGRHSLAQALFALRRQFESDSSDKGAVISSDRNTIKLNSHRFVIDALKFSSAINLASNTSDPSKKAAALEQAVALYTGEYLPGFYDDWVLAERQWLSEQFVTASGNLIKYYESDRQYDRAIQLVRKALGVNPYSEDLAEDLMRLLATGGQTGAALTYYRDFERTLLKEFGERPNGPLRSLAEKIRELQTASPLPVKITEKPVPQLPSPITRFFGREDEIAQVKSMLESGHFRLITITGMGGSGKTRLSIESAGRLVDFFDNAVYFVPLAELDNADQILGQIIASLEKARFKGDTLEELIDFLGRRRALLVLDNLEHLIEQALPLLQTLLQRLPKLCLIVTTRTRLGLAGEREIPLPPLDTPSELLKIGQAIDIEKLNKLDTIRLFVDRAQAVRPGFAITPNNALAVAQVCEKLEGIPLAIELCAAWAQLITPVQMLSQLDSRFILLSGRINDLPARHRSLLAVMEYSNSLLSDDLKKLFSRISVFRSGFAQEAAVAIQNNAEIAPTQILSALAELHSRSLITIQPAKSGTEMRYRMLDTVREFAISLLTDKEQQDLRREHAAYYLNLIEVADEPMKGGDQLDWLTRLDDEHENLRAAMTWFYETGDAEHCLRMASAMTTYWDMRGYVSEGYYWLRRVIDLPTPDSEKSRLRPYLAKGLVSYAYLVRVQGSTPRVTNAAAEGLRLYRELDDKPGMAFALQVMAVLAYTGEDIDDARVFLEEGLELARQLNDRSLLALSLANLGNIALEQNTLDEADQLYTESVKLYLEINNRHQASRVLNNLGVVSNFRGSYAAAREYLGRSLRVSRELSNYSGIALCLHNLGDVERKQGNLAEDVRYQMESAQLAYQIGERRLLAFGARELGHAYCKMDRYAEGIRLMAAAEVLRQAFRLSFKPADPKELEETLGAARTALGSDATQIWDVGLKLNRADAYEEILIAFRLPSTKSPVELAN